MNPRVFMVLVVAALVFVIGPLFITVVNEYERGVMLSFGKIVEEDLKPGIHIRAPLLREPRVFDGRVQSLDMRPEEYLTQEKKRLIVDSFVMWRVTNPVLYYTSTGGGRVDQAERLLSPRVNEGLRNQFGERSVSEVVSGEREKVMNDIVEAVRAKARDELGIEVVDVRVNRIELPPNVLDSVYNRMRAEREREAREHRSRGEELAEGIRADADRQRTVILAEAYRKAQEIRGEGDAKAAAIYADAFSRDREFYAFYRSLSAYRQSFSGKEDVMVIEPDSEFFRYLKSPWAR